MSKISHNERRIVRAMEDIKLILMSGKMETERFDQLSAANEVLASIYAEMVNERLSEDAPKPAEGVNQ